MSSTAVTTAAAAAAAGAVTTITPSITTITTTTTSTAPATNSTTSPIATKTSPNVNLANGSNLSGDNSQIISRRHSSEILVSLGNDNHNQCRSNEATNSNGYVTISFIRTGLIFIYFSFLFYLKFQKKISNPNCMRQLSADSITTTSHVGDVSTPSGSNSVTHKSSSDSSKRSIPHPTHNQQQQKQLGNLVTDINALALDNSSSQSKASQQQQQQQSRCNQATTGNQQNPSTPSAGNTNGNSIQTSTNTPSNLVWQQTSPNATNGSVKLISTESAAGKKIVQ